MRFINLTPHAIVLNDGTRFEPSGTIARVSVSFSEFNSDRICDQVFGEIQHLPEPVEDTALIVSGMVLSANNGRRTDLVAPATGHANVVRNDKGHIISVPGFVRA